MAKNNNNQTKKGQQRPKANASSLNSNAKEVARLTRRHKRVVKNLTHLQKLAKTEAAIKRFDSLIQSEEAYIKALPAKIGA